MDKECVRLMRGLEWLECGWEPEERGKGQDLRHE